MAHKVIMPKAGQTMEEGTVVSWLKQKGDAVEKGDPLMVIQTDKADLEVESTASGVLHAVLVAEGETVPVLVPVAVIAEPGEEVDLASFLGEGAPPAAPAAPASEPAAASAPAASAPAPQAPPAAVRATPTAQKVAEAAGVDLATVSGTGVSGRIMRDDVLAAAEPKRLFASPYARKLARDHGLDLAAITGSGPDGRIIKRDVEAALARGAATAPAPAAGAAGAAPGEIQVVELTGMRKAIAGALQQSKQQAPHFYAAMDVDMTRAMAFRAYLKETGRKVTVNDLVLRAAVLALIEHPRVNCRVDGNQVSYHPKVNLGVAVGLEEGLVVPVILDAGRLALEELAAEARRIAGLAREGKLVGTGQGTFTVTNLGMFGVESFSAIINPPEAAILAVGSVTDGIVVKDQTFSLRKTMKLTVSVDHRVVDGVLAAKFLAAVKEALENPESLSA
jgi:pyruvate dehydrogenase E2 component (dihydrolipoamide acetyltransferase)